MITSWSPTPPHSQVVGDHDVRLLGSHLQGVRVAILVSGGIAALKIPLLCRHLRGFGADVFCFVSTEALRYVTVEALEWSSCNPVIQNLTAHSEHLSHSQPFDIFLYAPATYNLINKLRHGIADTPVTTTFAAALKSSEQGRSLIFIAPTMHGQMHNALLQESLLKLQELGVIFIPPRDEYGKHNLPDQEIISAYLCAYNSQSSIKNKKILVTAGATPTPIDNVRYITNKFRGALGVKIAKELTLQGADVTLILGAGSVNPAPYLNHQVVQDFSEYREVVMKLLETQKFEAGIFSAAVADYEPIHRVQGKVPSGVLKNIEVRTTEKVIDLVRERFPNFKMMSFKYQENMSHEDLISIGSDRLKKGHQAVVVNRGEERGPQGEHIAYLMTQGQDPKKMVSKTAIAIEIRRWAESLFS